MDTNKISGGTASVLPGIGSEKVREEATDFADFTDGDRYSQRPHWLSSRVCRGILAQFRRRAVGAGPRWFDCAHHDRRGAGAANHGESNGRVLHGVKVLDWE